MKTKRKTKRKSKQTKKKHKKDLYLLYKQLILQYVKQV